MKKVSIIVPIYNCEKYLSECLESILNQSYSNLEVILINDGSSDDSKKICEEFCKKDNRFILINKENEGVSQARNTAIDIASGEYIMFVDADDWIEPNMCTALLNSLNNNDADIVFCNHICEYIDKSIKVNFACEENIVINDDIKTEIILPLIERGEEDIKLDRASFRGPWGKIFKRSIINNCNIRFNRELVIGEDFIFNLKYLSNARKVVMEEEYLYHYRINPSSALNRYKEDAWALYKNLLVNLEKLLSEIFKYEEYIKRLDRLKIKYLLICVENEMSNANKKSMLKKRNYIKEMCNDSIIKHCLKRYKNVNIFGINKKVQIGLLKVNLYLLCVLYIKFRNIFKG